jgi:hypothetical protein
MATVVKLYFNERNHSLPFAVGGSRMGVRGMDKQSKIELILALALSAPLLESRPWFWAAKPAAKRTRRILTHDPAARLPPGAIASSEPLRRRTQILEPALRAKSRRARGGVL